MGEDNTTVAAGGRGVVGIDADCGSGVGAVWKGEVVRGALPSCEKEAGGVKAREGPNPSPAVAAERLLDSASGVRTLASEV